MLCVGKCGVFGVFVVSDVVAAGFGLLLVKKPLLMPPNMAVLAADLESVDDVEDDGDGDGKVVIDCAACACADGSV